MHQNAVSFDRIEDQVVFFDEVSISKFCEFLFAWNSAEFRMLCEVNEALSISAASDSEAAGLSMPM